MNTSLGLQKICGYPLVTHTQSLHAALEDNALWDGNCGVDTVRIGFSINPDLLSLHDPVWKVHASFDQILDKEFEWFEHNIWIGYTNVRVVVRPMFANASIEFNAANVRHPKSLYLLEPNELCEVVEEVLEGVRHLLSGSFDVLDSQTGEIIRVSNWRSAVRFERLDLGRNFFIPSLSDLMNVKQAIVKATPRNLKKKETIESKGGGWTTYNKTSGSGLERFYDKHVELANHRGIEPVPRGTLRFETQLQGNRLKAPVYIKTLDQLSNETAWQALENRWSACKWGVPIMEPNSIYAAVSGLSIAKQESMLGFMMMAADGYPAPIEPRHLASKKKEARALGLVPGMALTTQGTVVKHLDLKAGGLVAIK